MKKLQLRKRAESVFLCDGRKVSSGLHKSKAKILSMLFIDTSVGEVALICVTSFIGIFAVSASLEGFFLTGMPWYQRLLLIYPGLVPDTVGLCLAAIVVAAQYAARKKEKALK